MGDAMSSRDEDGSWHLDKRVPLALIFTILVQTAMGFWWASGLTERVSVLERGAVAAAPQADRLTRVEVKIENIQSGVDEIKALIRQRPEPIRRPSTGDQQ
jgi:hypothetical protein